MRPICVPCKLPMKAESGEHLVMVFSIYGPAELWLATDFRCGQCSHRIVSTSFNGTDPIWTPDNGPIPEHIVNEMSDNNRLSYVFGNVEQREHFMAFDVPDRHRRPAGAPCKLERV